MITHNPDSSLCDGSGACELRKGLRLSRCFNLHNITYQSIDSHTVADLRFDLHLLCFLGVVPPHLLRGLPKRLGSRLQRPLFRELLRSVIDFVLAGVRYEIGRQHQL